MMRKRKKVVKYRGSKTHGGGSMKKRRGAGNRGGRGLGGSGKRGDAKKPSLWKVRPKQGKRGFTSKRPRRKGINVGSLSRLVQRRDVSGALQKEGGRIVVDLSKLGFEKLLGGGECTVKLLVRAKECSKRAKEKVDHAGGIVEVFTAPSQKPVAEEGRAGSVKGEQS
ncbi:50S ribosomal protein L15 [Candidatus Woesearchaeota archaeon]|nr:MAG: 50S ribosomal protein L15 [Candidatus Woesearchaeota archaeon]